MMAELLQSSEKLRERLTLFVSLHRELSVMLYSTNTFLSEMVTEKLAGGRLTTEKAALLESRCSQIQGLSSQLAAGPEGSQLQPSSTPSLSPLQKLKRVLEVRLQLQSFCNELRTSHEELVGQLSTISDAEKLLRGYINWLTALKEPENDSDSLFSYQPKEVLKYAKAGKPDHGSSELEKAVEQNRLLTKQLEEEQRENRELSLSLSKLRDQEAELRDKNGVLEEQLAQLKGNIEQLTPLLNKAQQAHEQHNQQVAKEEDSYHSEIDMSEADCSSFCHDREDMEPDEVEPDDEEKPHPSSPQLVDLDSMEIGSPQDLELATEAEGEKEAAQREPLTDEKAAASLSERQMLLDAEQEILELKALIECNQLQLANLSEELKKQSEDNHSRIQELSEQLSEKETQITSFRLELDQHQKQAGSSVETVSFSLHVALAFVVC